MFISPFRNVLAMQKKHQSSDKTIKRIGKISCIKNIPMVYVTSLNQNQNESIKSIWSSVICWKILFCFVLCSMISISDAKSRFNDGINEKYHLPIHRKELEKYKNQYQILLSMRKKKNNKYYIHQEYFQIKLPILQMNHQCDVYLWIIFL